MFPFQISSSYFEPETAVAKNSSSSLESASTCSDSDSSISTISSSVLSVPKISCFFDPSTCKRQSFSIPEKILYFIAKNATNAETFQKLVKTCKYFFKVNPVIVVSSLYFDGYKWYAYSNEERKYGIGFKNDQRINYKIWITQKIFCSFGNASKVISSIYKNDATVVTLRSEPMKFEDFLFLAGSAKELSMWQQLVKYENGKIVQLEDIVENMPKLKSLYYILNDRYDVNSNTAKKLLETEHSTNISYLSFANVSEALDVEGMFKYIIENKHIKVDLWYREEISEEFKELVQKYSNLLKKENQCKSRIGIIGMDFDTFDTFDELQTSSSEDDSSIDDDENEDLHFPWNNEEDEE